MAGGRSGRGAGSVWVAASLQIAVSAGLLALLVLIADWEALRDVASTLSAYAILSIVVLCLAAQIALVQRWRSLLDMLGVREPWVRSWHSVFAGLFLTNFLPGTLGSDGLRVVLLTRSCGRASTAIGAIAYERLMQLAIYLLGVAVAALVPVAGLAVWSRLVIVVVGGSGVIAVILGLYWLGRRPVDAAMRREGLIHAAWSVVGAILVETGRMQTKMRRHRRATWSFWGASLVNVAMIFALFAVTLADIGHIVGLASIVLAAGGAAIVAAIPISFGGIGVYEAAVVTLLGLSGVPLDAALVVALVIRCAVLAISLIGLPSAVLLWRLRRPRLSVDQPPLNP